MATICEITLTQNDIIQPIDDRITDILLKFRKKRVMKGVRMNFKFALQKSILQEWHNLINGRTLSSRNLRLLGAANNSDDSTSEYEDVDINYTESEGDSQVIATETVNVYFTRRPFIGELTIIVTIIIKKDTVLDWYDKYVGPGPVYQLYIEPSTVNIVKNGGSASFNITANVDWQIEFPTAATWITSVSPTSGSSSGTSQTTRVEVIASANDQASSRNATIKVYSQETGYKNVLVKQEAGSSAHTLSISPMSITEHYQAVDNITLTITSDTSWAAVSTASWCIITSSSAGNGNGTLKFKLTQNDNAERYATIRFTGDGVSEINVSIIQGSSSSGDLGSYQYSVGLLSDIHFHTLNSAGNRELQTKSEGNSNNDDASSFFKEDFKKLITVFEQEPTFAFIASPGDIATYDLNDFIYFTNRAQSYLGGRPFYCATGNHDHGLIYYEGGLTDSEKFLNPAGTQVYGNSTGGRWESIEGYDCPKKLIGNNATYFGDNGSYYVNYQNDIYVFIMTYYGSGYRETGNNRYISGSQVQPHNRLNASDPNVILMKDANHCNKPNIFTSGDETNFNFQYYSPKDLIYLSDTIVANNSSKRIFVFSHHFFTNKAGNNDNYHPGGSTCLMGLTLHFLNWINDNNKNVFFFTGHSHLSWKDETDDLLWTNKKFGYKIPTSSYNNAISDNNTWNIDGMHYYHNMWKVKAYDDSSSTVYDPYYKTTSSGEGGWNIHLPSMSRPVYNSTSLENACEGAILRVYEHGIQIEKIGYTTSDSGTTYTPYSSIAHKKLTVYDNGSWEESGSGGGGDVPTPGIYTDNCIEISINNSGSSAKYNSHIRFEFEDGGYLHVYCGGAAEKGDATYAGKYSSKYSFSGNYGWANLLVFVGDSIPEKFRYLAYHWGLAIARPADDSDAWIYRSEFFSEDDTNERRAYYGSPTGDPNNNPHWLSGSDKTEFINSMKNVLNNYQCKKLKSTVRVYYYDDNYVEQYVNGTLTDVCYHSDAGDGESIGLYFVNGLSDDIYVRYKIRFPS